MTHFRFRYKRVGYMRWRCRTASRRAILFALPLLLAPRHVPSMAARHYAVLPVFIPAAPTPAVLQVGDFVVSAEGDPQLQGHPDIRY